MPYLAKVSHESALLAMKSAGLWNGSFNGKESTLQQLAPYVGKLKSGIAHSLIEHFTRPGEWVCDPFSGSGVVPLEALLLGRRAAANDLSIYAYCLTRGKAEAPPKYEEAAQRVEKMLKYVNQHWEEHDLRKIEAWVREFYHPRTLKEVLTAFDYCVNNRDWFLRACLCGILHHQRPGFLSYPASHLVPYLRSKLFPRDEHTDLYEYRPLADRIRNKVKRAYRRALIERTWTRDDFAVHFTDARCLPFKGESIDFILTSPPYYHALSYARDNRLRLWFLGERDWRLLDQRLTARVGTYKQHMADSLSEMYRILRPGRYCVLVVGEVLCAGKAWDTGMVLGTLASKVTDGGFAINCTILDEIPDARRSRRGSRTTRMETVLVLEKKR